MFVCFLVAFKGTFYGVEEYDLRLWSSFSCVPCVTYKKGKDLSWLHMRQVGDSFSVPAFERQGAELLDPDYW